MEEQVAATAEELAMGCNRPLCPGWERERQGSV